MSDITIAKSGYCKCGCGDQTRIAKKTRTSMGHIKGEHIPFINGHNRRKSERWKVENRGYRTPCWTWLLGKTIWGYGVIHVHGEGSKAAHRVLYKEIHPNLPDDRHLDHLCRNRDCVNPDHLEPTTPAENIQRGKLARLTPDQVREIRWRAAHTKITKVNLAKEYEVSPSTIFALLTGRTWKNIEEAPPKDAPLPIP